MELHWLAPGDDEALINASGVFDFTVQPEWAVRFLEQPNHHLCIATVDGRVAGFVSGVETTHPDKGTEMFLYELGVDGSIRGRGIGKALISALRDRAEDRGCYGMWVLTEVANTAAIAAYTSAGGKEPSSQLMLAWDFDSDKRRGATDNAAQRRRSE